MNMIEKILAKASGHKEVTPGEVVIAKVDRMVMHDLSANFVTRVFREELGGGLIADPSRQIPVTKASKFLTSEDNRLPFGVASALLQIKLVNLVERIPETRASLYQRS